ncbi:MAG: glycosyltransferase [Rhodothermaceae bacterium]|nr:glycosyltransferase [Rhodothermaceae bacterium]
MTVFLLLLYICGAVYATMMGAFALGFWRARRTPTPPEPTTWPMLSVIVPARDEAGMIAACVESILANDYPEDRFEVIVVDDLSEDETSVIVEHLRQHVNAPSLIGAGEDIGDEVSPERLHLLRMPENLERTRAHKKRAIEKGIAYARGSVILTTDADCVASPTWLRTMAAMFTDLDAQPEAHGVTAFVSGPVLYRVGDRPFLHMQALEFLGLVAVGGGAIGVGRPTICNGANVAYRKDVFEALGGFHGIDHLTSGDDELLMQKIHDTTPHRVRYCAAPAAATVTEPIYTLRAFFEQRRRWASKGAHYPNKRLVALFVAIYGFYLGLLVGGLAWPFVPGLGVFLLGAFALKAIPEALLLWPACRHFDRRWLFGYFLPAQLLHIPYIVLAAAGGALGRYEWKGRRVVR